MSRPANAETIVIATFSPEKQLHRNGTIEMNDLAENFVAHFSVIGRQNRRQLECWPLTCQFLT